MEFLMVSIADLNIVSLADIPKAQASASIKAVLQGLSAAKASNAFEVPASDAGTNASTTGFTAAPRLSANVIDALLQSQAQQSAQGTTSTGAVNQATTLSGASAESAQAATSSDSSSSDTSSSKPPTLQDIANEFDLHHVTHQQEEQLIGNLVSSGNLSDKDGFRLFDQTVLADAFNSQHYRIINGQLAATTPSPPGTIIGNDAPGGPQYDIIQRVQQSLSADQYFGDTANAAQDQKILNVLNQLDSFRNGASTSAG
jgi:hypothetical protein